VYANREACIGDIGYAHNISPALGLHDASGSQLRRVLAAQADLELEHGWLTFETAYTIYEQAPGLASGGAWYHWTGIRRARGGVLELANSAPGYRGVQQRLTRDDWARLGPFSCLWVVT
jgi:hypothetical protein